ncbi:MAG: hypothetical protein IPJ60_02135 [Sphingobacteriaceae bacterium]|nr:hypothetical protein [Sphingobacteriaceae bacterium]
MEGIENIVVEMGKDVQRLELIADRFQKVGSQPDLTEKTRLQNWIILLIISNAAFIKKSYFRFSISNFRYAGKNECDFYLIG